MEMTISVNLAFTGNDVMSACKNNLCSLGHIAAAGVIAFAIDNIAHKIFKVEKDSSSSYAIKAMAFAAGTSFSVYLASRTPLYQCTGSVVVTFMLVETVAAGIMRLAGFKYVPNFVTGAFSGWLGSRNWAYIPSGIIGAGIGTAIGIALERMKSPREN